MKWMDFFAWQGVLCGNDEQRSHAEKDAVSCCVTSEADH
jgi:hypothetical protein